MRSAFIHYLQLGILVFSSWGFGDPYKILDVSPDASLETIKKAYLEKVKTSHPDVSDLPKDVAVQKFKEIQRAFESIQASRKAAGVYERFRGQEEEQAKKEALAILEAAWEAGKFSFATLQELPRYKSSKRITPVSPYPTQGARGTGEWQAIEDFFGRHLEEYLGKVRDLRELIQLLQTLDVYMSLSPQAGKALREGFATPIENTIFERAVNPFDFLDALRGRIERAQRTGAFISAASPEAERKKALGNTPEQWAQRFGDRNNTKDSPETQLAQALLDYCFSKVAPNPVKLHELGFFLNGISPMLEPEARLNLLGSLLERLENMNLSKAHRQSARDIERRAERMIRRLFEKYPDLKKDYVTRSSFWSRLLKNPSACDLLLGRIARQRD